jgi:hypothetical protein
MIGWCRILWRPVYERGFARLFLLARPLLFLAERTGWIAPSMRCLVQGLVGCFMRLLAARMMRNELQNGSS